MAAKTRLVPRSGWMKIKSVGSAIIPATGRRLFHVWKPVYIFEGFYLEGMTHCPLRYALHFRVLLFTDEYDGLSISHEVFGDLLVPFDERARRVH